MGGETFTASYNAVKEWCTTAYPGVNKLTIHHFLSFGIAHSLIKRHLGLGNDSIGNTHGVAARADIFIDGRQLRRNVLLKQPLTDLWLQFAQAVQPPTVEFNAMGEGEEGDCLTFTAERDEEEGTDEQGEGEGDDSNDDDDVEHQDANDAEEGGTAPESDGSGKHGKNATNAEGAEAKADAIGETGEEQDTQMDCGQNTTGSKRDGGGETPSSKRTKQDATEAMDTADEFTSTAAVTGETYHERESEL